MARRVVPEQDAASGCSSSSNFSSSQSVSSVAVDCTASAAAATCAQGKARGASRNAEEASRGNAPSSGADPGTSSELRHEEQKVCSALRTSVCIVSLIRLWKGRGGLLDNLSLVESEFTNRQISFEAIAWNTLVSLGFLVPEGAAVSVCKAWADLLGVAWKHLGMWGPFAECL